MARKRMISPSLWTDDSLIECSRDERLLFIGLISNADDEGRMPASPRSVKCCVFPGDDDLSLEDVDAWLGRLDNAGVIRLYEHSGKRYLYLHRWEAHQSIRKPSPSPLPPPNGTGASPVRNQCGTGASPVRIRKEGRKEGRKERRKEEEPADLKIL
ncbi:hypothetical protein ACFL59_10235 [Planctomycetota bacterium]